MIINWFLGVIARGSYFHTLNIEFYQKCSSVVYLTRNRNGAAQHFHLCFDHKKAHALTFHMVMEALVKPE